MRRRGNNLSFWLFLLPALLIFANVVLVPFVLGIINSFTDWDGFKLLGSSFSGFKYYAEALADGDFLASFLTTFKYAVAMVALVNLIGFSLALLVTGGIRSSNALRATFFMPNLIGGLILGFIWQFVFTKMTAGLGESLHMQNIFFNWLTKPGTAFWSLVIVGVWQMAGYVMIVYIAGLQGIPGELIEAAQIEGAGPFKRLLHITLPLSMPAFTVGLFITLSASFKQYDTNLSLTNGGPYGTTQMLAMNIIQTAFKHNDYALAQSKAVLFFLVIMAITLLQVYLTKRREVEM
jgi:raffinose/stachyose/melibiose transport system permease protein